MIMHTICDCLTKTQHVCIQTEFHFISQLLATINNLYVHCLLWLMSTDLLFQSALCQPCKYTTSGMAPMEGFNMGVGT